MTMNAYFVEIDLLVLFFVFVFMCVCGVVVLQEEEKKRNKKINNNAKKKTRRELCTTVDIVPLFLHIFIFLSIETYPTPQVSVLPQVPNFRYAYILTYNDAVDYYDATFAFVLFNNSVYCFVPVSD